MSSEEALRSIVDDLAAGFESLLRLLEDKQKLEHKLRRQLSNATKKSASTRSEQPSGSAISDWREEITNQISSESNDIPQLHLPIDAQVSRAKEALNRWRATMPAPNPSRKCPVRHVKVNHEDLEQDFTTNGKPSNLGCPFASIGPNPENINGLLDPIAAEFHQDEKSAATSAASGGPCRVCPIRFLDKHSPEEIAQYFENHKHEIPRSHEICVKRYQKDESSIRELDERYGNLVSMIQGLGNKHKAYLPIEDANGDREQEDDKASTEAVQKWAEKVDVPPTPLDVGKEEEEPRVSHFEKPLRDVRVGESPSRPWGISVPLGQEPAVSAKATDIDGRAESMRHSPTPAAPLSARSEKPMNDESQGQGQKSHPSIIFNGPVFFGYSAESAAILLQSLGLPQSGN